MSWIVHKFGGSSLADAARFSNVANIVESQPGPRKMVVVSAMGGVTDALLELVATAEAGGDVGPGIEGLRERYEAAVVELLGPGDHAPLSPFQSELADMSSVLKALALVGSASHRSRDLISGLGELWSARLLTALLESRSTAGAVEFLDARDVLVVEPGEMGPAVRWDACREKLEQRLPSAFEGTIVVTGFIARDPAGLQTNLGRNGSDFSASIFAALLSAREVNIWTDVDGVMSGDPRRIPESQVIQRLSYSEAMELAYFGAKVIHPQTMAPAVGQSIPIRIRNSFAPQVEGTVISSDPDQASLVKGITAVDGVALVNLEGAGMIGVPGTADRLFGALRQAGVSVVLISQGSSEHSICFAVPESAATEVKHVVERAFATELAQGQVQRVEVSAPCSILAVVGDGMAGLPGIAGQFFGTLGRAGINVRAIAQGASERNISAVIDGNQTTRALRAVHSSFYLSHKTISIGLVGPGAVGRALLGQIDTNRERLQREFGLDLRVRGVAASRRMWLADKALPQQFQAGEEQSTEMDTFTRHVQAEHLPHTLIIDCSAAQVIADRYQSWLEQGIHVITPNKKAHSGSIEQYEALQSNSLRGDAQFLYEATVGAGLPVIQTLRDLVRTGDRVRRISGIFSGTLAYLFNVYDGSVPFSQIVRDAKLKGYTEPDPRDDLSGMDVARKLVILAREAGLGLELEQLSISSLVPEALAEGSAEDFLDGLAAHDGGFAERLEAAEAVGEVLRYVGSVDLGSGEGEVALQSFPRQHPFATIALTDNIIQFETERYCDNPLIIRGPGAGPEVTAAGIFADVLRLCATLGGRPS